MRRRPLRTTHTLLPHLAVVDSALDSWVPQTVLLLLLRSPPPPRLALNLDPGSLPPVEADFSSSSRAKGPQGLLSLGLSGSLWRRAGSAASAWPRESLLVALLVTSRLQHHLWLVASCCEFNKPHYPRPLATLTGANRTRQVPVHVTFLSPSCMASLVPPQASPPAHPPGQPFPVPL